MRGKDGGVLSDDAIMRITPAYAGKSSLTLSHKLIQKDHPRLCGEKIARNEDFVNIKGSPPPMRGKVHRVRGRSKYAGITPAYAGKSRPKATAH